MARHPATSSLWILGILTVASIVQAQSSPDGTKPLAQRDKRLTAWTRSPELLAAPSSKKNKDKDTDAKGDDDAKKKDVDSTADDDAKKKDVDAKADDDAKRKDGAAKRSNEKGAPQEEEAAVDPADAEYVEAKGTTYQLLGLRARMVLIPQFMFGLFGADGGRTVWSPQVGPEFAVRRNGFEYDLWLTYSSYSMSNSPFKSSSDPDTAYEIVSSSIKTISIGSDFLWSAPINPRLSFVYGGGAGIGVVFGDLNRTQSYPPGTPGDPNTYLPCVAPGNPSQSYCGNDNTHYPGYKEPSWISGGSKPIVFPWIAPFQMGLRWKPSPKVALRLDTGFSFPGPFFFGLSGQYGLF
jgi:hypothetical protein